MESQTNQKFTSVNDDKTGLERLAYFSDAVFAIAITLLALDIHLPVDAANLSNVQLRLNLVKIWPKYLSFIISFLVIGNFWISHHRRFSLITSYDNRLLALNLLVLMSIAFIPFSTSILSENGNRTATIFYALSIATTGLLTALLWWYASRDHRLIKANIDKELVRRNLFSILTVPGIFILSIGLTFINPDLAKFHGY